MEDYEILNKILDDTGYQGNFIEGNGTYYYKKYGDYKKYSDDYRSIRNYLENTNDVKEAIELFGDAYIKNLIKEIMAQKIFPNSKNILNMINQKLKSGKLSSKSQNILYNNRPSLKKFLNKSLSIFKYCSSDDEKIDLLSFLIDGIFNISEYIQNNPDKVKEIFETIYMEDYISDDFKVMYDNGIDFLHEDHEEIALECYSKNLFNCKSIIDNYLDKIAYYVMLNIINVYIGDVVYSNEDLFIDDNKFKKQCTDEFKSVFSKKRYWKEPTYVNGTTWNDSSAREKATKAVGENNIEKLENISLDTNPFGLGASGSSLFFELKYMFWEDIANLANNYYEDITSQLKKFSSKDFNHYVDTLEKYSKERHYTGVKPDIDMDPDMNF